MNKFKSTILTMSIFFYVLCAVTLSFVAVNFLSTFLERADAIPQGGLGGDQFEEFEPGGGGGSDNSISWRYWVDNEDLPEPSYASMGGSGTQASPYLIYNQEHFDEFLYKSEKIYNGTPVYGKLMQDFYYYTRDHVNGVHNTYAGGVSGMTSSIVLDGNYKRIHLDIVVDTNDIYSYGGQADYTRSYGLMGSMYSVKISNLKLTGKVRVSGNFIESVGSVVGACYYTSLENCYIATNVDVSVGTDPQRHTYVGGIVGMTTSINETSGAGQLYMKDSVFCGKIEVNNSSYIYKCGHLSTTGSSAAAVQETLTNSYYKYHKVVGVSVGEMKSSSITTQTFDKAYTDYKASDSSKAFVTGEWDNVTLYDYYYCAAPTVAWICHRSLGMASKTDNGPIAFKYVVKKNGGSSGTAVHLAWAVKPGSSSATASSVKFSDLGIEYTKTVSYTIDRGYEVRTASQNTSGYVCTLTITLDFKVEVVVMTPHIVATSTALNSSMYTLTDSGSVSRNYPDLISFTYNSATSKFTLSYGSEKREISTSFKTNPNPYEWATWRWSTTSGTTIGTSGNLGSHRSKAVLDGNRYILRIYPLAKLKTYNITIN